MKAAAVIEKLSTIAWFAKRPAFYAQMVELAIRKFRADLDGSAMRHDAAEWARQRARPLAEALSIIGLTGEILTIDSTLLAEAEMREKRARIMMGGAGDLSLLHTATVLSGARLVIETGVAYGWSSLAILSGLARNEGGLLVSVDMPYPKRGNEPFVGLVVPDQLRANWVLIREPDRNGLKKAIAEAGGKVDLVHYDSDKSYYGRRYAYPLMWQALKPGGIFISDDIQDNLFFAEFVKERSMPFAVVESGGKFVGAIRKLE